MKIFIPMEHDEGEDRCPVIPSIAGRLAEIGAEVFIEQIHDDCLNYSDDDFRNSGVTVVEDVDRAYSESDLILRLRVPPISDIDRMKEGAIHISYLDPFNRHDVVRALRDRGITAISMEMIPRTTVAQKMDSLSSQASLAGYKAVIVAAERSGKALPMMMTPAGTIVPARVFVIGAGVAGLQAIATAKRLGARVEAFDTRPVVEEQVKSLGAKFIKIDIGDTGQTKDGYAKQLTPEQLEMQREGMAKILEQSDIVITTAQVFGRKAPRIITKDMIMRMKPGSVIVDMAVETGGNVEGSIVGEEVDINGVKIIGIPNLPGKVAMDASFMYASNLFNFVEHFWDSEKKELVLDLKDEILAGCVITHEGKIVNETIRLAVAQSEKVGESS